MAFLSKKLDEPGRISASWDPRAVLAPDLRRRRLELEERWRATGGYAGVTLAQALAAGVRRHPQTPIIFQSEIHPETVTLAQIDERAQTVAAGLHALGVAAGDAIAVQLPNWPQTAVAYHAIAALGAVLIPIVSIYGPTEVGFILRQSGARALILPDRYRRIDATADLPRLGHTPSLRHVIVVGDDAPAGTVRWDSLERSERSDHQGYPAPPADPDALAVIVYTSGTTAEPKGAQHSHESLLAELREGPTPPAGVPGTISLQPFPAGHTAGLAALYGPAVHGYPTVLLDSWDAAVCAALIERHRVTAMAGTPFLISTMLDAAESNRNDISSLRHGITGGAGVPPALIERADALGWRVGRCYGSTEQPSITACAASDPLSRRAHTDGRAIGGGLIRIVDLDGRELPAGEEGEIVAAGPEQFIAYTDPALNRDAFTADGWFRTGDVGRLDADGYVTITDRRKDIVIRGGENISSQEVENILAAHPAVSEAAVVGAPDPRYGERVCAYVVLRPGATLDLTDLTEHFTQAGVARHKTPELLRVVADLPRTAAGKVRKAELRAALRAAQPPA
jgi:acyl-CoA synthetase (AMP-forming)/AMP-acid ligase II